jgi:hypothetical protein
VADDPSGNWARSLDAAMATVEQVSSGTVHLTLASADDSQRVLDAAREAGTVEHFSFENRLLSEVFRDVVGEDARELEGRGVAWTEERGTSDKGRRRSEGGMGRWVGARKRPGNRA